MKVSQNKPKSKSSEIEIRGAKCELEKHNEHSRQYESQLSGVKKNNFCANIFGLIKREVGGDVGQS